MPPLHLVFFGSPEFAVPSLRSLLGRGHRIAAVYTQPDRPAGRLNTPVATPVRSAAEAAGIPVRTPKSLRNEAEQAALAALDADAFVVVAFGRLLPEPVLAIPRLGVLNVHPSLLPLYRGPSPVQQAILDGAAKTGVSVMLLDEGMDTGPVLAQVEVPLEGTETGGSLTSGLFETGAGLLVETLDRHARGEITPQQQDSSRATVTSLLERSDGEINWAEPAEHIARMVRAYDPWPGTFTRWRGQVLKVLEAWPEGVSRAEAGEAKPGAVVASDSLLSVQTGQGAINIHRLQLEGKKAVAAGEFIRGYPAIAGSTLPS